MQYQGHSTLRITTQRLALSLVRNLIITAFMATACDNSEDCDTADLTGKPVAFPPKRYKEMPDHLGDTIDLRQYRGKIVLLNFWATWCGPCRYEIPDLIQLRKVFTKDDLAVIGVGIDIGTDAQVQNALGAYVSRFEINYPIVRDNRHKLVSQYFTQQGQSMGVPLTYIIDRKGRIYRTHVGLPVDDTSRQPAPFETYRRNIETLLNCDTHPGV